jgi:uncharacterized membrane protein YgcG
MSTSSEDSVGGPPHLPVDIAANNQHSSVVKLPPFWPSNPAAWFANADGQFALRNITDQRTRYYNVLTALPESTVNLIADLVESEDLPVDAYFQLRARLNAAHTLTDYQKVEQLFALPPLGARRPSEMLAEMVRLCPRGQEDSVFFTYCFLHRLPRELRVLLTDVDHSDRRSLAVRADRLWSHNFRSAHDSVNAVADVAADLSIQDGPVAAVQQSSHRGGGGRNGGGRFNNRRGRNSGSNRSRGGRGGGGGTPAASMTPSDVARAGSDLCFYHWSWGEKASQCIAPCGWQGN